MKSVSLVCLLACLSFAGCMAPYDSPMFVDIGNSETAFVIEKAALILFCVAGIVINLGWVVAFEMARQVGHMFAR